MRKDPPLSGLMSVCCIFDEDGWGCPAGCGWVEEVGVSLLVVVGLEGLDYYPPPIGVDYLVAYGFSHRGIG